MKYVCLIYNEDTPPEGNTAAAQDGFRDERLACAEELRRKGHFVAAHALQPGQAATTVRVRSGRVSATTGAAGGLRAVVLIDAWDLTEAIRLASQMPDARLGSIEIRPMAEPE
jgi:hypothetical protein